MSVPEKTMPDAQFSLANRNNPYSFDEYLEKLNSFDFYADDPFLQRCVKHFCSAETSDFEDRIRAFSRKVSFRLGKLADHVARKERHPYLEHYDAHNHRIDRIVRPGEAHIIEKEVLAEALFSERTSDWESFVKRFLLQQLGETLGREIVPQNGRGFFDKVKDAFGV